MIKGPIRKMSARLESPIAYDLPIGDRSLPMNPLIGNTLRLAWEGQIVCLHCGRETRKSFGQGHCYPCFRRLARCDSCMVKPELCHYAAGTCREPDWGEQHCLIPHTVYLANSSGLKVGITRGTDPTTRWIDQGASQAMAILIVPTRLDAGKAEVALKPFVADKTNWRAMLRGIPDPLDLPVERDRLLAELTTPDSAAGLTGSPPAPSSVTTLDYPVSEYPTRITSHNLEKQPVLEGALLGIKGQYLIFDRAVINLRKYGGYVLSVMSDSPLGEA